MIRISNKVSIAEQEVEISAVRSRGKGGQNVNKVATAIHLRFDIRASSLPDFYKTRLLNLKDHRKTKNGIIVIKAMNYRTQEQNKTDAISRLIKLIQSISVIRKTRKATKATKTSVQKRLDSKKKQSLLKKSRKRILED